MGDQGESTRVFVHNLPYNMDEKDIRDFLRDAGEIRHVDVKLGRDGRPRGIAIVEFEKDEDAKYCISKMDETKLDGRTITCREDRGSGYVHPDAFKKKGKGKFEYDYGRGSPRRGGGGRHDSRARGRGRSGDRYGAGSSRGYGKGGGYGGRGNSRGRSRGRRDSRGRGK
ncbi:unnamed protein product [Amoebophrya sp. A25]|nr:unnamed protein product [Amoebophrya sp. A25]|eukprot:GSA25T00019133001.1